MSSETLSYFFKNEDIKLKARFQALRLMQRLRIRQPLIKLIRQLIIAVFTKKADANGNIVM